MGERAERSIVERALLMRDLIDGELESADRIRLGRVADVVISWHHDRSSAHDAIARVTTIVLGPEALAGRIRPRLRGLLHRLLGGRWERELPLDAVEELGPTLRLREPARAYRLASGEWWVGEHLVRHIPGAGRWPPARQAASAPSAASAGTNDARTADSRRSPLMTAVRRDSGGPRRSPPDAFRGADLIGARVRGPGGEDLGRVLDVELRPKDGFALDSVIGAKEPALARLVLLRQVGPRPDRAHTLIPWRLVERIGRRTIHLAALPSDEGAPAAEQAGEARGATPASAVGERPRTEAAPAAEDAAEPQRRERRARQ
jgi:sporulation protein YlmC with PRC-barrel domain